MRSVIVLMLALVGAVAAGAVGPNGGWDAAWSPDGSRLAFISGTRHGVPDLWMMAADGRTPARWLTNAGAHVPVWLPDNTTIAIGTMRTGTPSYLAAKVDGMPGSERPITALPAGAEDPLWSRDGRLIAYALTNKDNTARDLCFTRATGGRGTALTKNFWVRAWAWSPDGTSLAFIVGKATGTSAWLVNLQSKEMSLLFKGYCGAPAYSPDGKYLVLAVPNVRSGFQPAVIDLAARKEERLTVRSCNGQQFLWAPDSSRLYFISSRKSESAIWSIGVHGDHLQRLTPEGLPAFAPALSPDGQRLAFHAQPADAYSPELYTCDTAGKNLTRLTHSSAGYWSPVWSPDGTRLAYQTDVNHLDELYLGAATGAAARRLTPLENPNPVEVCWFTDGKRLLVQDAGRLFLVKASGGKDAATLLPGQQMPAQAPVLAGGEIFFTEWRGQQAGIAAVKPDGSGKRILTKMPPKTSTAPAPILLASAAPITLAQAPQVGPEAPADDAAGNPHHDLGVMAPVPNLDTTPPPPPQVDLSPAVAPDRKTVAFVRRGQVWLVNYEGTRERQLTQFAVGRRLVLNPTWSPKGGKLLFLSLLTEDGTMTMELWVATLASSSEKCLYRQVVNTEFGVFYSACTTPPVFTPDGARIIFTALDRGEPRIVSLAADGSGLRELVAAPAAFPALNAAGTKLAYVDLAGARERLRVLDLQTGKPSAVLFAK